MTLRLLVALVGSLATSAAAQTWSPFNLPGIPFGQVTASSVGLLSATYDQGIMRVREWDGTNWIQRNPTSTPPPRDDFAMAYDSIRQRVVLFGGRVQFSTTYHADTWEWTGTNWQPQVSLTFPTPRARARMAFDSARSRMVLFGGDNASGPVGDTWEYSAPNWIAVQTTGGPPPRVDHAMAFDSVRQRAVLFGGTWVQQFGDTWEWDGAAWLQRTPSSAPSARSGHGMAFDPYNGGVMLFGGVSLPFSPTYHNDAYVWNGSAWVQKTYYATPTPRSWHAMALNEVHQSIVVLGGNVGGPPNWDGWVFPGSIAAVAQAFGTGCGSLTLASTHAPILGQAAQSMLARPGGSMALAFMALGLSHTMIGPFTLPLPLDGFGLTGCFLYHDVVILAAPTALAGPGQATYSLGIPNLPALSGMQLFLQGWVFDPSANPGGVITSNALRLVLGNF